jgi:hypothetical protein
MRYPFRFLTAVLGCAFVLACTDTTSPSTEAAAHAAGVAAKATSARPFKGTCTFVSTVLPPEQGQPPNEVRFEQDVVCQLTHLGLTTAVTLEIATFTPSGPVFVTTVTYTAANGDQLFTTQTGTGTLPDQNGDIHFSGTETVTGGTGRFSDASGSFSFTGSVTPATLTGQWDYLSGTLSY